MFALASRKFHSLLIAPSLFSFLTLFGSSTQNNQPPVAVDDSYTIHGCATPLLPGVTANDSDPDSDPFSVTSFPQAPAHGSVSRAGNSVSFCPAYGYVGADSFTYQICDDLGACAVASVDLNIVNQAPSSGVDSYDVHGSTVVGPFLVNDSDPDGDPVTIGDVNHPGIATLPQRGSLSGSTQSDKKLYGPTFGYTGLDSFTYNACDGLGLCTPTTVNINVKNNPPSAVDDSYEVPEPFTVIGPFLANDSDPDGDSFGMGGPSQESIVTFPQHGSLSGLIQPDKKLYSPAEGYSGTDSFVYAICDDLGKCSRATVTLNIGPVPTPTPTPTPNVTPTPTPPVPTPTPTPEPLVFIPGASGSYLVDKTNNAELWPGLLTNHNSLSLNPVDSPNPNIIATDAIRTFQILGFSSQDVYAPLLNMLVSRGHYLEYRVNGDPARRTTAGCDLSQKSADGASPSLFVFAYDWRKSNVENASKLSDYIGCVEQLNPNTKVNILTHSMGAFVARRYILDNPGKVKRLVTIAASWVGTPKADYALETGDAGLSRVLVWRSTLKRLAEYFPSIHELMPSSGYYEIGGLPFAERGDFNQNGVSDETYSYSQEVTLLDQRYPQSGSMPGSTNLTFHSYPGQYDWRTDNTGVEYHHIFGEQHLNQTIGQVVSQRTNVCVFIHGDPNCFDREVFTAKMTNGDGTVPKRSAMRIGSLNLNAPTAKLWYLFSLDNDHDELVEHTALTQLAQAQNLVLFVLGKGPDPGVEPIARMFDPSPTLRISAQTSTGSGSTQKARVLQNRSSTQNSLRTHHQGLSRRDVSSQMSARGTLAVSPQGPADSPKAPAYYLTVMGVDFVSVTDDQGNTNMPIDDTFALRVPNVTYNLIGEKAVLVSMPTDKTHRIEFRVGSEPVSIEILRGLDNSTPTQAVRYRDAAIPAGATAIINLTPNGIETLRFDSNGDGILDGLVTPTASLIGAAAADVTPPSVNISGNAQQSSVLVTIHAQDTESSVESVYYSLDRIHYQRYVDPFPVNPVQTPTVFAFADDNAANRSPLITYAVPQPPTIMAPQNVSFNTAADATVCGITVSDVVLGNASANSNASGSVTVTRAGVPAGNFFPVGTTCVTYTAINSNGLTATATQTVTVIDTTPPTLTCPASVVAFLPPNSTATSMTVNYPIPTVTENCSDGVDIAGTPSPGSVFPVGTTAVLARATDALGNLSSCSFTVSVLYEFNGFSSPVSNLPVLNTVNAGRAIPIKFSLSGYKGQNPLATGLDNPASGSIPCDSTAIEIEIAQTLGPGNSSLSYDAGSDQYVYVWKTESSWAGTCRQFVLQLNDGTVHRANFRFK